MHLVKHIFDIGYFVRALQVQMRFGDLSRAPLRLLRLELGGEAVECDWMARAADEWDADIPRQVSCDGMFRRRRCRMPSLSGTCCSAHYPALTALRFGCFGNQSPENSN